MDRKRIRERLIRAAWEERGRKLWDSETHGKGLPLNIPGKADASIPTVELLARYDGLEFQFFRATGRSQPFNYIACEGIVLETWGENELPRFAIDRTEI
jgi:hypothetical protein